MPPKKKADGPSKKAIQKQKEKIIEDKTFGMKNKKGKKQQEYIKNVQHQVNHGNVRRSQIMEEEKKKAKKKEADELLKPAFVPMQQKVPFGVDPKSIVCSFFKAGQCQKGNKCKFSHDLASERKTAKIDIYSDKRDEEKKNDTMDQWDQDKLEKVVASKSSENPNQNRRTDIICKFFLDAIEKSLYGWFWECPNGNKTCQYRHALPPGYILKKDKKKMDEQREVQTLEELIEEERKNLPEKLTPVNLETLKAWREKKKQEIESKEMDGKKKRKDDFNSGKGAVSGRELFEFNPDLFEDDDDALGEEVNDRVDDFATGPVSAQNIDESLFEGEDLDALNIDE
eukprot:Nk52_evm63s352 gene=Nk52_evmTU63s352